MPDSGGDAAGTGHRDDQLSAGRRARRGKPVLAVPDQHRLHRRYRVRGLCVVLVCGLPGLPQHWTPAQKAPAAGRAAAGAFGAAGGKPFWHGVDLFHFGGQRLPSGPAEYFAVSAAVQLSAHRTPEAVEEFAKNARSRGIKVIIAAAGMAAALPGVIAANTTLPVIGVPVKGSVLDGVDALYSIIQMPPGIPVATVAINGAMNAAILAIQMLALSDAALAEAFAAYKEGLKKKIVKANEELKEVKFEYKTN